MKKQLWVVRPEPNFVNRLPVFLDKGIVAIGWPKIGDLTQYPGRPQLSKRLCQVYDHYLNDKKDDLAMDVGVLDRFVNEIKPGDYALIPQNESIFVSEVTGDYVFHPELDHEGAEAGYPHWRAARFLKGKEPWLPFQALPTGARRAMNCNLSVFAIHSAAPALWSLLDQPS
ncbi:MAG: hypothetical protein LBT38_09070 [Deltaproteobacteria bacterium]|jgi:predicted Mrr-cat superfamily restriction endonuclease|nr:hypothetical protein [Deltaproteobacteria bacterium]